MFFYATPKGLECKLALQTYQAVKASQIRFRAGSLSWKPHGSLLLFCFVFWGVIEVTSALLVYKFLSQELEVPLDLCSTIPQDDFLGKGNSCTHESKRGTIEQTVRFWAAQSCQIGAIDMVVYIWLVFASHVKRLDLIMRGAVKHFRRAIVEIFYHF